MQQRAKSKLELALDHCEEIRLAHEALHGSPDDYNRVSVNPINGLKQRVRAYSETWYASYDKWTKAYNEVFQS